MGMMLAGLMMAEAAKMAPAEFDHATCVCGLAIIRSKQYQDQGWYHSTGERGCHAALFDVDPDKWSRTTKHEIKGNARPAKRSRPLTPYQRQKALSDDRAFCMPVALSDADTGPRAAWPVSMGPGERTGALRRLRANCSDGCDPYMRPGLSGLVQDCLCVELRTPTSPWRPSS